MLAIRLPSDIRTGAWPISRSVAPNETVFTICLTESPSLGIDYAER